MSHKHASSTSVGGNLLSRKTTNTLRKRASRNNHGSKTTVDDISRLLTADSNMDVTTVAAGEVSLTNEN